MTAASQAPSTANLAADRLFRGVLWALASGVFWGGAFIAPVVLAGYSALDITAGRFAGSGLFSLVLLGIAVARGRAAGLADRQLWVTAFGLAMLGSFFYYLFMVLGVQRANAAIVTLIIGLLPVTIPLVADVQSGTFSLRKTMLPGALMLAGLLAVHHGAHGALAGGSLDARYVSGLVFATIAMIFWLIYALRNAKAMSANPHISAANWSSLQNVSLLPLTLPLLAYGLLTSDQSAAAVAARPSIAMFLGVSMALGIATSWLAMWSWNKASQLLPPSLAGQLLVFETFASLTFVYVWSAKLPPLLVVLGATLVIAGVVLGIRRLSQSEAAG
jgi:drug/metabolite transporter (DMT)-like permease